LRNACVIRFFFAVVLATAFFFFPQFAVAADESEVKGEEPAAEIERPTITGWHNWRYNSFSSHDQLRINAERSFSRKQKFFTSLRGLHYQEESNKSWKTYLGETYYKLRQGPFDVKLGLLVETLGSGDKISHVDKLNSRRYYSGLANDYNRDKKEVPAAMVSYYVNPKMRFDFHYLPVFQASEMPSIYSRWASAFQTSLGMALLQGGQLQVEKDNVLSDQFHVGFSSSFKRYEIRYHYFRFKERLPVVEQVETGMFRQMYPRDETFAIDGNITLTKEYLMRFEFAYTHDKTYSTFQDKRIGYHFRSDQYGLLLGSDYTFKNQLYVNVQGLVSHITEMKAPTPFQLYDTEAMGTVQFRRGFKSETIFLEFNGVQNFTTGEYILTPQAIFQLSDYLKFTAGVHLNGDSTDGLGPIGQFNRNNTPYFETHVIF
jgi:hypothetical protein